MHNWGDVAMLATAVERLGAPGDGELHVLTRSPERIRELRDDVVPVVVGRPARGFDTSGGLARRLKRTARAALPAGVVRRIRDRGRGGGLPSSVRAAIEGASLLVCSGGGYLAGTFPRKTAFTLDVLDAAAEAGVPTALLGQGLGPFDDDATVRRLGRALRAASIVSLRDPEASLRLVQELGVAPQHVHVTGDDAIELAAAAGPDGPRDAIGVNMRSTDYSRIGPASERALGEALATAVGATGATPCPIPIASTPTYSDVETIRRVLAHAGVASDGGASVSSLRDLFRAVASCRTVVTASYHGAVFALAQGATVVALTASDYYDAKFAGLASAFDVPGACTVVRVDGDDLAGRLDTAILDAWRDAERCAPLLRDAASRQVRASRSAYQAARACARP